MQFLLIVKPHATNSAMAILGKLPKTVNMVKFWTINMDQDIAKQLYQEHKGKTFYERLIKSMSYGQSVVALCEAPFNVHEALRTKWLGPTDPEEARKVEPLSIRAIYGTKLPFNALHMSDSEKAGKRELQIFFSK